MFSAIRSGAAAERLAVSPLAAEPASGGRPGVPAARRRRRDRRGSAAARLGLAEPFPEERPPLLVDRVRVRAVPRQQVRDVARVVAELRDELFGEVSAVFAVATNRILDAIRRPLPLGTIPRPDDPEDPLGKPSSRARVVRAAPRLRRASSGRRPRRPPRHPRRRFAASRRPCASRRSPARAPPSGSASLIDTAGPRLSGSPGDRPRSPGASRR